MNDSAAFEETLRRAVDRKTKPVGSLGRIEWLAGRIARVQGSLAPRTARCRLLLFAADHGIAAAGVSAYPQAVTRQMVGNLLAGGAAANVFARTVGVELRIVDAGVAGGPISHPDLLDRRIGDGTANAAAGPAMTRGERDEALGHGERLGGEEGFDALALGEMGIANTASAALLAHKILGLPLDALIGPGAGLDNAGVERKRRVLRTAAARTPTPLAAEAALAEYGGFEVAMMAGAMLGGAARGRLVLVDGYIATAAAAVALALRPETERNLVFAHRSAEPGHDRMLAALAGRPLLDLEMRLGEGTGALLAWPLVQAAAAMLREMASFEDAGISGPV